VTRDRTEKPKNKPVTEAYLERAALHYLGRFNSSEQNLIRVLERKVRRRNPDNSAVSDEQMGWIRAVAQKCVGYGYVDDALYARQRFGGLRRKGKPLRTIAQDLRHKGVPQDIIEDVLNEAQTETDMDSDLPAAAAYVRRRRFGPFRRADNADDEKIEKEKAAMMRTGFSYRLVVQVLESSEDELLSLLP